MTPLQRTAAEAKHSRFLANVTGLDEFARMSFGQRRTLFEAASIVALSRDGEEAARPLALRIRSVVDFEAAE